MTNVEFRIAPAPADLEGGLASLRGDCARMAPHWAAPEKVVSRPVSPSRIHGVSVPARSARLLEAMPEYGN
ncbi:hypothetical protein [Streptomyces sp. DSM 15324]|uniref:hypothetical protein n=1 Tax=Streptomyces sp. DSM 15324 TaxID=1739111 RepID=UPI000748502C|nr:hypothetical protein [Streptomyces sp. DSM 15324]KUO13246.1 hypothetical protein AQJ58_05050 [Streptomyces sp. DSM 15324]